MDGTKLDKNILKTFCLLCALKISRVSIPLLSLDSLLQCNFQTCSIVSNSENEYWYCKKWMTTQQPGIRIQIQKVKKCRTNSKRENSLNFLWILECWAWPQKSPHTRVVNRFLNFRLWYFCVALWKKLGNYTRKYLVKHWTKHPS